MRQEAPDRVDKVPLLVLGQISLPTVKGTREETDRGHCKPHALQCACDPGSVQARHLLASIVSPQCPGHHALQAGNLAGWHQHMTHWDRAELKTQIQHLLGRAEQALGQADIPAKSGHVHQHPVPESQSPLQGCSKKDEVVNEIGHPDALSPLVCQQGPGELCVGTWCR